MEYNSVHSKNRNSPKRSVGDVVAQSLVRQTWDLKVESSSPRCVLRQNT